MTSKYTNGKRFLICVLFYSFCLTFLTQFISKFNVYHRINNTAFLETNNKNRTNPDTKSRQTEHDLEMQFRYKLFNIGPQFAVSFSPLYKGSQAVNGSLQRFFGLPRRVSNVDCSLLFENNLKEIKNVRRKMNTKIPSPPVCQHTKDCGHFISSRGYITDSLSDEEKHFPIAYSILVYKSPEQFEFLLRAIYRPQNVYCVHVDKKTHPNVFNRFKCITRCFPNVFFASKRYSVNWGEIGVLLPEIECMRNLLSFSTWKYFINLTGQEFPLRTNYELVKILKIYNGSNDAEGTIKRANKYRWNIKEQPPHDIHPVKGSVHVTLNRKFVEYVINNDVAADFLAWVNKTEVPDETYFATLIHNPKLGIPGSFKGDLETDFGVRKPFLSRFKNWEDTVNSLQCHGKFVRSICIFGVGDLPLLARRPEFFANKFHHNFQSQALLCMDELIHNRTREEYYQRLNFDTEYYEELTHIKNIVKK